MKKILGCLVIFALAASSFGAGMVGGVVLDRQVLTRFAPPPGIPTEATEQFKLMAEAWNAIDRIYVDRSALEPTRLAYGAISGMVDSLGDTGHSRFLSPMMALEQVKQISGQFEGIGAEVQMKEGQVVIAAPIDGSPAEKAGLRPGDIILKVDADSVAGLTLDQVIKRIQGPSGSTVSLTLLDPKTGLTRDVTITRAKITVQNVSWQRLPGTNIAHLRIAVFSAGVGQSVRSALREMLNEGITGVILDVRNNPGGLLSECVTVASQFLKDGDALLERDADGTTTPVPVEPNGAAPDTPLVVLIDAGTASASEVSAGALQDRGRAQLVGETTFGTGTVLTESRLSDGSVILLAFEEWLTPGGRVIWHKGLTPDVMVAMPAGAVPLRPSIERDMTAEQLRASQDAQLLKALELLEQAT